MHPFGLVTCSAMWLAAAPATSRVGVVWHDQATVAHDARQRLARALAVETGLSPDDLIHDADLRARVAVAYRLSPDLADRAALLDVTLTGAAASYRAGEIDAATKALDRIEASLRADPGIAAAATLLGRAAVLRAQIAWTQGDDAAAEAALRRAVVLDPTGRLSTRRVPPTIAAMHQAIAQQQQAERDAWQSIEVVGAGPSVQVDVDGRPSPGPVPAGEHFVVVRRPGHPPVAAWVKAGQSVEVPRDEPALVAVGLPRNRGAAEAICAALELDRLVLARSRGGRVGVQAYECGHGFAPAHFSADLEPDPVIAEAIVDAGDDAVAARLHLDAPWPAVVATSPEPIVAVGPGDRGPDVVPRKPWFRRAWVWVLIGGAVAGAVTTGVVLGTRGGADTLQVDTDTFMPP